MTDIDQIVSDMTAIEYDNRKAVALIEYKFNSNRTDLNSANIAATEDLANRANLPFFIVQYDSDDWEFMVRPRNAHSRVFLEKRTWMDEQEFVSFLHKLRGKTAPIELLGKLRGDSRTDQDQWEDEWTLRDHPPTDSEINGSLSTILGEPWVDWEDELSPFPA